MKVNEIIAEAQKNTSNRKTKNSELYFKILCGICTDDDYVCQNSKIVNGEIITEDRHLSTEFRKIFANALKKATSMSEAEAMEAAANYKLSSAEARTLADIVHETDYVAMKKCGKKVQLFSKPDFNVAAIIKTAKESTRPNPQNPDKKVKIAPHDYLKTQHTLAKSFKKSVTK